jgi:hypothetical protein
VPTPNFVGSSRAGAVISAICHSSLMALMRAWIASTAAASATGRV